ncbi:MAG: hypothetical protein ACK4FK_14635 [Ferrovibrio sp.]|uniref:hypothetical protein n=1 Tax=Ferrovibrio sp. TaxID=1917215 RepID=UPI00391A9989
MAEHRPETPKWATPKACVLNSAAALIALAAGLVTFPAYSQQAHRCDQPSVRNTVIAIVKERYRKLEGNDDGLGAEVYKAISTYVAEQNGAPFPNSNDTLIFLARNESFIEAANRAASNPSVDLIGIEPLMRNTGSGPTECRARLLLDVALPDRAINAKAEKFNRATQTPEPYTFTIKPRTIRVEGFQVPIRYVLRPKGGDTQVLVYGLP